MSVHPYQLVCTDRPGIVSTLRQGEIGSNRLETGSGRRNRDEEESPEANANPRRVWPPPESSRSVKPIKHGHVYGSHPTVPHFGPTPTPSCAVF
ncbi:hypothetical protein BHE74_00018011 [Ensete ventricosum]|nr:hypothetical protein GW17_00009843 [Ensete ventricosum]RWW74037.1 hypothetical protein BHE74_00018011 [Ensete ventricosum]